MWKCHKCGKPVYFAERKQSLGYDWHPECLRCEECGKRLNPGQHAEHKGVPYCHVPCYGALFGPQLFGHGTRVESHKNFGVKGTPRASGGPVLPRDHLESKLKLYNQYFDNKSLEIRSREVNNRLVLEGALRICWGVHAVIHLKEDDDQRTVVTVRKRNSCRLAVDSRMSNDYSDKENDITDTGIESSTTVTDLLDGDATDISMSESITFDSCSLSEDAATDVACSSEESSPTHKAVTLPSKLDVKNIDWDEIDDLLQVERKVDETEKLYQTMPSPLPSQSSSEGTPKILSAQNSADDRSKSSDSNSPLEEPTTSTSEVASEDTPTLKPMDFDDFNRSVHEDFINGANDFVKANDDTLKMNQPIDPSRINDSLKLYSENMSKSFCESALRPIDPFLIHDTLSMTKSQSKNYVLQKSESASSRSFLDNKNLFEKGINRSKSGPNCYVSTDSEDESTAKAMTMKRNENPKFININMNCYNQSDDNSKSVTTATTPSLTENGATYSTSHQEDAEGHIVTEDGVVLRRRPKTGSTAIKRRSGNKRSRAKLKRRCSINGHFYNRETSFFTPPHGSQMSVWVTSLVNTQEVINLLLEKYKVDSKPENFALFVIRDNGEQRRLKDDDYPLVVRVMLGPHEDVARLFLMDAQETQEISNEVAQFLNLSIPECRAILDRYDYEMEREVSKIKSRYEEMRRRIIQRMESLKVRL
ncbi:unnamed protein product [Hermetia illucens]|uniref:Ras association domain-containing protein 2 n=1 Tax=Hermetia illucens TaxID=343691 RepID=A0A7R8UBV3_HERIL|nr:uncharacterized protein LOC119657232 [Hermetia illucens]CAD7077900.1 unnamed protein product [Hermetia illucens]